MRTRIALRSVYIREGRTLFEECFYDLVMNYKHASCFRTPHEDLLLFGMFVFLLDECVDVEHVQKLVKNAKSQFAHDQGVLPYINSLFFPYREKKTAMIRENTGLPSDLLNICVDYVLFPKDGKSYSPGL